MPLSALADPNVHPDDESLRAVLGRTGKHWNRLLAGLHEAHDPLTEEWHFAGASYGWSMRVKAGKRTLVYLIPRERHFLAGIVFGVKAVEAARSAGLPDHIMRVIEDAPVYAEGRGFRVEVRNLGDLAAILELVAIKLRH